MGQGKRARRHERFGRRSGPGASPGTLVADPQAHAPQLSVVCYGPAGLLERRLGSVEEIGALLGQHAVVWIDVSGLADIALLTRLGELFGLHRLALEDVLNVHQRPKAETYGDHRHVVARMVEPAAATIESEQLSLFVGAGWVLSFQERPGDCFEPVRARIRSGKGQIRRSGSDYLAYALLDAVIDGYFPLLERYGERLQVLEETLVADPRRTGLAELHEMRRELLTLRRAVWPLREAVGALLRETDELFRPETRPYLNDCYDHTVQLLDLTESYREVASGLVDIYLSSMGQRMNEIVKVLTIISTLFIPLTFIAGVYGMNFDPEASPWNLPETRWWLGYPLCLAAMAATAVAMLLWFRRLGWIGAKSGA